jgi:hypothetical protein
MTAADHPTTPAVCGAAHYDHPETVCTEPPRHRLPHSGPLIIDVRHCGGAAWDEPDPTPEPPMPDTVHACPPDGSSLTPCCHRPPTELPRTDRITNDPETVTCTPAPAPVDPALTDRVAGAARAILDGAGPRTTSEWATLVARAVLAALAPELARVPLICSDDRHQAKVTALEAERDGWAEALNNLLRIDQPLAALARVRELATTTRDNNVAGTSDYAIGRHDLAIQLLTLLDGLCSNPHTDTDGYTWHCERALGHEGPHRAAPDAEHHMEWPARPAEGSPR